MTVLAYRIFFRISYSTPTWLSLIPLTVGVGMACSANIHANFTGLLMAFASAVLFVTQNIVSKQIFNDAAQAEKEGLPPTKYSKPDKLNLLCYSSGVAFVLTLPIWLWSEGFSLILDFLQDASLELSEKPGSLDHGRLIVEFVFNGTFHFGQNIVAFVLLSMVSPVTYSVASLMKRVFVIVFAIIWFHNPMTRIQGFGVLLTFLGLYLYDRTSDAGKKDRLARAMQSRQQGSILPMVNTGADGKGGRLDFTASPSQMAGVFAPLDGIVESREDKRSDERGGGGGSGFRSNGWMPPGGGMNGRAAGVGVQPSYS